MPVLREIEERAYRAIVHADTSYLAPLIVGDELPAESRIQVYQNNARESFIKTLAASYPVIMRLVGESCFRSLGSQYMRRYPSRSGDLQQFGRWFPSYLELCYSNSEHDYLTDVARLEWACEEVRTAPPAGSIDLDALVRIPDTSYPDLRFNLHPAHRIVSSQYPVLTIWQENQTDFGESVDLRCGAEFALVLRRNGDIELRRWPAALATFAVALGDGSPLGEAYSLACTADAAFNLGNALSRLASLNLLCGFHLADN